MPDKELATIENNLLHCEEKVILAAGQDRRANNIANAADAPKRTDPNLTKRIQKFQDQLKNERVYRVSFKFLFNFGLVNQSVKFNTKFTFMLEREMNKLFETNANDANPLAAVDVDIILTLAPYLQYEQIKNILKVSWKADSFLRAGVQKRPYQKTFEVNVGSQSHVVGFMGAHKQFSFISISLVYD